MIKKFEENSKVLIADVLSPVPKQKKIKKSEYQKTGLIPVIDQGSDFVAGYTDDLDRAYRGELPVVVFGDHTRVLKFVSFRFSAGADGTQVLKPIQEFDERYFYYSLVALNLKNYGYERHFKYLKEEKIIFRPLPIQRKIAAILSAYDDLIENDTRRLQILEEMAQRFYQEWFVHFRYPGHEGANFVESKLGKIPDGWDVKTLEEISRRITDGSHWSPKSIDQGYPMASVKDMHNWGINIEKCRTISEGDFNKLVRNDCKPMKNDVLIAKDGSYLKHIFVTYEEINLVILSSIAIIRPNELIKPRLLAHYLKQPNVKSRMTGFVTGAALPRIILKDFRKFLVLLPPMELQEKFNELIEPMCNLCVKAVKENINLRQTRDLLLPKLISGKIDVSELDIDIGEKYESLQ